MEKKYIIEEIKEAFWQAFHKSGELWFSTYEEDCEEYTTIYWIEFLKKLELIK